MKKAYRYILHFINGEKAETIIKAEDEPSRDAFITAFINCHNGENSFKDDVSEKSYLKRHILAYELIGEDT